MKAILDIDGVLCDFIGGLIDYFGVLGRGDEVPSSSDLVDKYDFFPKDIWKDIGYNTQFWLDLPKLRGAVVPEGMEVIAYLTARRVKSQYTSSWLTKSGFPTAKFGVITVADMRQKVTFLNQIDHDVFVDDYVPNVRDAIEAGHNGVLHSAPFHCSEDVSDFRVISGLEELL